MAIRKGEKIYMDKETITVLNVIDTEAGIKSSLKDFDESIGVEALEEIKRNYHQTGPNKGKRKTP